jgi:hypothetical protein
VVTAPKHNVSECPATALPVHATPVALPDVRKATGDRKSTNTDASSAIFVEFIHELAATHKADQPDTGHADLLSFPLGPKRKTSTPGE